MIKALWQEEKLLGCAHMRVHTCVSRGQKCHQVSLYHSLPGVLRQSSIRSSCGDLNENGPHRNWRIVKFGDSEMDRTSVLLRCPRDYE